MKRTLGSVSTLLALTGALGAGGCASFPSEEAAGDASSPDATGDGSTVVTEEGGGHEGGVPDTGSEASNPLPDGSPPTDGGCKPESAPDASTGVFVAQGGGPAGMCGAINAPCGTIAAALSAIAQSSGTKNMVYVEKSSTPYTEQVTLPAGVTIQGGWTYEGGGTWARTCPFDPSLTVIEAPAGSDRVVVATYTGSSSLDTLTVKNATTPTAGQSLYGIFATGATTKLTLTNVDISVAPGGAGTSGAAQGVAANNCTGPLSNGTPQAGPPGSDGAGAQNGTYSAMGYQPPSATAGSNGGAGQPGDSATAPAPFTCPNTNCCDSNGCTSCSPQTVSQGTAGSPGCGGGGSLGGTPGTSGGSSIGILAWDAAVSAQGSITTGSGGAGGNGGVAASPAPGTTGASGNPGVKCPLTCTTKCIGPMCTSEACLIDTSENGGAAGAGTAGAGGGTGGTGGGGAGGDSICIVFHQGSSVTTTTSCTHGAGGTAGTGGSPMALAGRSDPTFTAP